MPSLHDVLLQIVCRASSLPTSEWIGNNLGTPVDAVPPQCHIVRAGNEAQQEGTT